MNVVRLVVWSSIVVIVVLLILAATAHAQPISEQHCCKVWLPVVQSEVMR